MTTFSNNLKFLRKEKKLSQQQVADNIGIKQRAYSDYENAKSEPTVGTLIKIASFFRVSIDQLLGFVIEIAADSDQAQIARAREKYNSPTNAALLSKLGKQAAEIVCADILGNEPRVLYPELEEAVKEEIQSKITNKQVIA
jgi:transcriptional regulator with XRE-family HTH domain